MQALYSAGIDIFIAVIFGLFLIKKNISTEHQAKLTRLNKIFTILLCIFIAAYLIAGTIEITQSNFADLWSSVLAVTKLTSFGQMVLLALITSLIMLVINLTRPSRYKQLYLLAILILIYAKAATGHAADYGLVNIVVFIHALHILAGCAWAGSVAAAILMLPQWRSYKHTNSRNLAHRLSHIATIAVPIVIVCGVIDSFRILYGAHEIWSSGYFITLAIKVTLVLIAILLGLINRWYWMPKIDSTEGQASFIQTITIESVALLMILIAAGQLGFTMIPS